MPWKRRPTGDGRRQAEDALRLLFAQVPAFIWTTDADLRVTELFGQAARAADLTPMGSTLRERWGDDDPNGAVRLHERALAGESVRDESTYAGRTLRSILEPLRDGRGAIVGVIGVALDVTEERGRERELRQAQKLDALGRLAGGIAHDYNNMLLAIGGNIDLALAGSPADAIATPLRAARGAVERSTDLTRRLLDFARDRPPSTEATDVATVVRDAAQLLRATLGSNVALEVEVDSAPPVRIDRVELEQVVMNLALNARDALGGSGRIGIAVRRAGADTELVVEDDGEGIPAELRDRLFEPFVTTRAQGTGLGLATVYGIVARNGGTIEVESDPGSGARFRVRLPAA